MKNSGLSSRPVKPRKTAASGGRAEHLQILASYAPDALEGDAELAAITRFAAHLCGADIAAITVAGGARESFLASHGTPRREIKREVAFCPHAMKQTGTLVVPDASKDSRFADYPSVKRAPRIRFYAGQPLITPEGVAIGTLSILDHEPRPEGLTEVQREGLEVLADAVMLRLRAHRKRLEIVREAEAREAQFRTLADSIPAIAWTADAEGKFEYFNKQMVEFTGDPEDKEGKSFHPDDWKRASAAWQNSLRTGKIYQIEHRLCRHDGEYRWMISRAVPVRDEDGKIVRWFGTAVDIHDIYAASEARDLLAKELSHRIKNIFAVIAGLVQLLVRKRPEYREFADDLSATIRALGRAHDFVRPAAAGEHENNLQGLLEKIFAPYGTDKHARVRVGGDDCPISSRAATPLALVFHELATNAAKYGALATTDGHVELQVEARKKDLQFTWTEHGGSKPKADPKPGFGTRLVEMSVTGQLGGCWERKFSDGGLVVELTVAKKAIAP